MNIKNKPPTSVSTLSSSSSSSPSPSHPPSTHSSLYDSKAHDSPTLLPSLSSTSHLSSSSSGHPPISSSPPKRKRPRIFDSSSKTREGEGGGLMNAIKGAHQGRILMLMENEVEPSRVATMATDGCVKLWEVTQNGREWDMSNKGELKKDRLKTEFHPIDFSWSPRGNQLLIALPDEERKRLTLVTTDYWPKTKVKGINTAQPQGLTCVDFMRHETSAEKNAFVAGSRSGRVDWITLHTNQDAEWKKVVTEAFPISCVTTSPHSSNIFVGTDNEDFLVVNFDTEDILRRFHHTSRAKTPKKVKYITQSPINPDIILVSKEGVEGGLYEIFDLRSQSDTASSFFQLPGAPIGLGPPCWHPNMDKILLGGTGGVHVKDGRKDDPYVVVKREGQEVIQSRYAVRTTNFCLLVRDENVIEIASLDN